MAVARFDELVGEDIWQDAVADITPFITATAERARELGAKPRGKGKEEVIVRRFYSKDEERYHYALSDPWLRIAANDTVLDIVKPTPGSRRG